ncbi:MAG: flavin reductase family protein [Clostridia bacterium]|nr:flavin reductase family protein [Clostridia bacterium]
MGKVSFKPGTFLYPVPAVLVSCGDMTSSNIITIAWTGIVSSDPAMTYVSIRKERHSYDIIKNSGEFCINLASKNLAFALDYCGVKSGKNEDKFKSMNLTKQESTLIKAPMISESPVNIECRVKEVIELGSHDMFLAEIIAVNVDEKYIDENGRFDMQACNLIAYSHGEYYELGDKLGKFGYSVKKDK